MSPAEELSSPDREQTDESLRVEREKADLALGEKLAAIDESADVVIGRARARADEVLAAARAKTDKKSAQGTNDAAPDAVKRERVAEDQALRAERADEDRTVIAEREEHAALLATNRRETDEDLLRERGRSDDALAMRDEFLGIVSHDLRNILGAMVGFAELISTAVLREDHVPDVLRYAQRIRRSGARMNRLIGDLVDVASIEAGMLLVLPEADDAAHVVTEAVEAFQAQATASGLSLVAEVPAPVPAAFDAARILQVLTNLLSNAIKFTQPGGKVVVQVRRAEAEVVVEVSDTGVGIPTDKLESIFERFYQVSADRRGVGLGLYISKCIVLGHGGRIWAESRLGVGSTVRFTLPVAVAK